jgi:hypothetical protein
MSLPAPLSRFAAFRPRVHWPTGRSYPEPAGIAFRRPGGRMVVLGGTLSAAALSIAVLPLYSPALPIHRETP